MPAWQQDPSKSRSTRSCCADPDARQRGRSAFVRTALRFYLEAKQRRELEAQLGRAYQGRADDLLGEVADMITDQPWPAN